DAGWNSLERYEPGRTHLLHYTDMDTQPWVSTRNPLGHLWVECLRRALDAGFISREELAREVAAGHVRPSLVAEVAGGGLDRSQAQRLDAGFRAPYKSIRSGHAMPWTSWRAMARAGLQRLMRALPRRH
ncbi:MAG: hypothetical protein ABW051_04535, partial [Burkholderiaceae bacterium]